MDIYGKREVRKYLQTLINKNNGSIEKTLKFLSSPELSLEDKRILENAGILHDGDFSLILLFYYLTI